MSDYTAKAKVILKSVEAKPVSLELLRTFAVWYKESLAMNSFEKQLLETIAFLIQKNP